MEIASQRRAGPKRIGELLVAANAIKPEVLLEALQVAKKSATPIGRVLMGIGELTERDLQAAIEVQSLLRENCITTDFGIRALNLAIKGCMPLEQAFLKLGWKPPERDTTMGSELGQLLLEAGIVDIKILDEALRQSQENNLPLGRCLVLARALSSSLLTSALTAQVLLRDGKISSVQAINGLKSAARKHQTIEMSLQEVGAYRPAKETIRVGDLLTSAGLVTEGDKTSAIELGLVKGVPVGQVLVESGTISEPVLDQSLTLQRMVAAGEISGAQAADILKQACSRQVLIQVILEERSSQKTAVAQANNVIPILQKTGILTSSEMQKAETVSSQLGVTLGEVLLTSGTIGNNLLQSAVQAQDMLADGILKLDQLTKVLQHCHRTGMSFPDALHEVPWDASSAHSEQSKEEKNGPWLSKLWSKVTKKTD
jgi:hypothetical protein